MKDIFGNNIKPNNIFGNQQSRSSKRTLGIRDRQILFERAKHKCEACKKKIDYSEMQVGHKKAYSKGGATTMANSVCLCYKCNKLQGTDSFDTLIKKLNGEYGKKNKNPSKIKKKRTQSKVKPMFNLNVEIPKFKPPF